MPAQVSALMEEIKIDLAAPFRAADSQHSVTVGDSELGADRT
jgi:hypothetical protein